MSVPTANVVVTTNREALEDILFKLSSGSPIKNLINEVNDDDATVLFSNQANPYFLSFEHSFEHTYEGSMSEDDYRELYDDIIGEDNSSKVNEVKEDKSSEVNEVKEDKSSKVNEVEEDKSEHTDFVEI